jgi:hypothetical protein
MSRPYKMMLSVSSVMDHELPGLLDELQKEFTWEDYDVSPEAGVFVISGEGALAGGESEEEFNRRIVRAVLRTLKRQVHTRVSCLYLGDQPWDEHYVTPEEMDKMLDEVKADG